MPPDLTINQALDHVRLDKRWFVPDKDGGPPVLSWHRQNGKPDSRVVILVGPNGGGKSLVRRLLMQTYHNPKFGFVEKKLHVIHLSMQGRTSGGIERGMVYGCEDDSSTGQNSCHMVAMAIKHCRAQEGPHVLLLDEPDVGLSDEAALGAGMDMVEFCAALPELTLGVVLTSHSRHMISPFEALEPIYLHVGHDDDHPAPTTLAGWLNRKVLPRRPKEVDTAAIAKWRAVQQILNRNKEK